MSHTKRRSGARKAKKSYTLSPQAVAFLETMRKKRHARSTSHVLEEILQAFRRSQEKLALEKAVTDYYTSLSPADAEEQARWGEFALREFPKEVG
ncbi:MAG TPA: hypothetical protein VLY24_07925 [Bryobacteraceae bacterium]|nr:hypothetical protein [Bryobacteraceae bacterium]